MCSRTLKYKDKVKVKDQGAAAPDEVTLLLDEPALPGEHVLLTLKVKVKVKDKYKDQGNMCFSLSVPPMILS